MKKLSAIMLALSLVLAVPSAKAFTVHDPIHTLQNIFNHLQEMMEWSEQLGAMYDQIEELEAQYEAMTGSYGLHALLRDHTYQGIPTDWEETLDMMERGDELGQRSREIRDDARYVSDERFDEMLEETVDLHEGRAGRAASHQSANAEIYERAAERLTNINALINSIDTTADMKSSNDLIARLAGEQALLQNELLMLMARAQIMQGQLEIDDATLREGALRTQIDEEDLPAFDGPWD